MKVNYFINYYRDNNDKRQEELVYCVISNIHNIELDTVNIIIEHADYTIIKDLFRGLDKSLLSKVRIISINSRPMFNDYFTLTEQYPDDINIISNTDMIMDAESLVRLKNWQWKNYCLVLSRWDFKTVELKRDLACHFNRSDSQDTWMVKGTFPNLTNFDYGLGIAGVDNSIAYYLARYYEVINPSLEIKTFHYHLTQARNYKNWRGKVQSRVPEPYLMVEPSLLP